MKEFVTCVGIAIVVVAAVVIILVAAFFLISYSETVAGLLALLAVVTFVVYAFRNGIFENNGTN